MGDNKHALLAVTPLIGIPNRLQHSFLLSWKSQNLSQYYALEANQLGLTLEMKSICSSLIIFLLPSC